jgi:hypothetical protein
VARPLWWVEVELSLWWWVGVELLEQRRRSSGGGNKGPRSLIKDGQASIVSCT